MDNFTNNDNDDINYDDHNGKGYKIVLTFIFLMTVTNENGNDFD